jgi:putative redox protein
VVARPPIAVELIWAGDLEFDVRVGQSSFRVDSKGAAGPSPVQALAVAFAACMSMDLAHILRTGRHPFRSLRSRLSADRAQQEPHRVEKLALSFTLEGAVPAAAVERAIALSREKYCSVWHSLRQDIDLQVTFEIFE